MSDKDEIINELLREKNLWEIYLNSRQIKNSEFNVCVTVVSLVAFGIFSYGLDRSELIELVEYFVSLGLQTSIGIVGFLVAGFTIFATISRPDMFLKMAEHINEKSQLSTLKHNFFTLYRVFIYYMTYIFFCIFVLVMIKRMGFECVGELRNQIVACKEATYWLNFIFVLSSSGLVFVTLQLKSFIFNIYHAVMTSLSWHLVSESDASMHDHEGKAQSQSADSDT